MMRKICFDESYDLVRCAVLEDGKFSYYYETSSHRKPEKGNVYRAQVRRIEKSLNAAFLDYGSRQEGFLPLKEVGTISRDSKTVQDLEPGNYLLVQVTREASGNKGATLTTRLSLPGRYLVYMPNHDKQGVSSRLHDLERTEKKEMLSQLTFPAGSGIIIRTASRRKSLKELQKDLNSLLKIHDSISAEYTLEKKCGLIYGDSDFVALMLREFFSPEVKQIVTNSQSCADRCRQFFRKYNLRAEKKLKFIDNGALLFHSMGLESKIADLSHPRVNLKSGASIVIQQTEALVSIDVNSSKTRADSDFETFAFEVNKCAAEEIATQLKLRELGGIIVVDFIDMQQSEHRQHLVNLMSDLTRPDRAIVEVHPIGPLGTMIINRQRQKVAGSMSPPLKCPFCRGMGSLVAPERAAFLMLVNIEARLSKIQGVRTAIIKMNEHTAGHLLNIGRSYISQLEEKYEVEIIVQPSRLPVEGDYSIELIQEKKERAEKKGLANTRTGKFIHILSRQNVPSVPADDLDTAPGPDRPKAAGRRSLKTDNAYPANQAKASGAKAAGAKRKPAVPVNPSAHH